MNKRTSVQRGRVIAALKHTGLSLLVLLTFGVGSRAQDGYPRNTSIDALHYVNSIELGDTSDEISARTEILFGVTGDAVDAMELDLIGMKVDGVTHNGRLAEFSQSAERLSIGFGEAYRKGSRIAVAISFRGAPRDGLFFKKNRFGDRTIFADNWPNRARHWFPSIDHPYDKATVEFLVTAPERYSVVANGALVEIRSNRDGTRVTHWRQHVPIPTYCMVIGAAQFSIVNARTLNGWWSGLPLFYYFYPQDRDRGVKDFGRAVQMLDFYTDLIGPYPYEKLALVQSTTRFGGMENSGAVFFDENAFDGSGRLEGTVAHEIAHQWFGDSVTQSDWHHLWLSEGFATYFGHLFFEKAEGRQRLISRMRSDKERYLSYSRANLHPISDPTIKDLFKLLNPNNYQKGAWVLHMLRREMGDARFFAGIRDYYRTYRDRNALTEDFQRVMELHAERSLNWFFNQWIYTPGHPVLEVKWRWNADARVVVVDIIQKQDGRPFRFPFEVELKFDSDVRREVTEIVDKEHMVVFKADTKPAGLVVDPDEWVLKTVAVSGQK